MTKTAVAIALAVAIGGVTTAWPERHAYEIGEVPPTAPAETTGCAGEWTRAVATINDPTHNNTMVIRNAFSLDDAVRRAGQCRGDATNVTYFNEGARLACAPYIACG